jgi:hypothetical protein
LCSSLIHLTKAESSFTNDLVVRFAEFKLERPYLMARLQQNLHTLIAAARAFELITAMWTTSLKEF